MTYFCQKFHAQKIHTKFDCKKKKKDWSFILLVEVLHKGLTTAIEKKLVPLEIDTDCLELIPTFEKGNFLYENQIFDYRYLMNPHFLKIPPIYASPGHVFRRTFFELLLLEKQKLLIFWPGPGCGPLKQQNYLSVDKILHFLYIKIKIYSFSDR